MIRMKNHRRMTMRIAVVVAGLVMTFAPASIGQSTTAIREEEKPIKQWIAIVLATGAIVAIGIKNPKRSHQD